MSLAERRLSGGNMNNSESKFTPVPLQEVIKSIPGFLGLRLEEEPHYRCLIKEGSFEVRQYDRMLVAQVRANGEYSEAMNEGFHKFATYIFGEHSENSNLLSTNPMSMTTPVFQQQLHDGWVISFVLGTRYDIEDVPRAKDPGIKIIEFKEKAVAVYRYTGNNSLEKMLAAEQELKAWLLENEVLSKPRTRYAQYDAPFTIPFLKRNEVQIEVLI